MKLKRILPVLAGMVAASLMVTPVHAQGAGNDGDRIKTNQIWQQNGQVTRRNSDRLERLQNNRQSKRAERRAERQALRKARKGQRDTARGAGTRTGSRVGNDALHPSLQGYDLPDYIGGYNQPKPRRTAEDVLGQYDLPDYIGGYQDTPEPRSAGEILEQFDLPDYIGGY